RIDIALHVAGLPLRPLRAQPVRRPPVPRRREEPAGEQDGGVVEAVGRLTGGDAMPMPSHAAAWQCARNLAAGCGFVAFLCLYLFMGWVTGRKFRGRDVR